MLFMLLLFCFFTVRVVLVLEANLSFEMFLIVVCFQPVVGLPVEVVEMIVMKAAASLHRVLRVRLLPCAYVTTLTTLCSVCLVWWTMITGRAYNKRQLRRIFTKKVGLVRLVVGHQSNVFFWQSSMFLLTVELR
jgi:hypothetical protein